MYAFVKFYSARAAANAKEKIHGKWFLGGQALKVGDAASHSEKASPINQKLSHKYVKYVS